MAAGTSARASGSVPRARESPVNTAASDQRLAHRGRLWLGVALLFVIVCATSWVHWHTSRYDDAITLSASRYGVDFYLAKALIFEESWFRPEIRGSSGEIGLMQVSMAAATDYWTHKGFLPFTEARLFEPELNIDIGCWYLRRSTERYASTPHPALFALLRYNAGEVRADAWLQAALRKPAPPGIDAERYYLSLVDFPKTREYARRIIQRSRSRNFWF